MDDKTHDDLHIVTIILHRAWLSGSLSTFEYSRALQSLHRLSGIAIERREDGTVIVGDPW